MSFLWPYDMVYEIWEISPMYPTYLVPLRSRTFSASRRKPSGGGFERVALKHTSWARVGTCSPAPLSIVSKASDPKRRRMPSLSWYKRFGPVWLSSETRMTMTLEERGLYTDLLDVQASEGSIPRDERAIQVMAAAKDDEFQRAWPRVSEQFVPHLTNRLINLKLKDILDARADYSEAQSERGKKGAKARWQTPKQVPSKRHSKSIANRREEKRREGDTRKKGALPPKHSYGEFGRVLLTSDEANKLSERLGPDLMTEYIERFDLWVEESPATKTGGVRRDKRSAYASILSWYRRDLTNMKPSKEPSGGLKYEEPEAQEWTPESIRECIRRQQENWEIYGPLQRKDTVDFIRELAGRDDEVGRICKGALKSKLADALRVMEVDQ